MALISCPECGREVSSSAVTCPACAYPLVGSTPTVPPRAESRPDRHQWWKTAVPLVGRVLFGVVLIGVGIEEEDSVAAVVGGTAIAVSAIPAWYRSKIERLKSTRGAAGLEDRFENRLAEFEYRQQELLDRLERTHTGQMAELEERVDFAERLLAKQRDQIGPS